MQGLLVAGQCVVVVEAEDVNLTHVQFIVGKDALRIDLPAGISCYIFLSKLVP